MAKVKEPIAVSVPYLSALWLETDELHVGMKEYYAVARVESGHSEWWSRGKVWRSTPGTPSALGRGAHASDHRRYG